MFDLPFRDDPDEFEAEPLLALPTGGFRCGVPALPTLASRGVSGLRAGQSFEFFELIGGVFDANRALDIPWTVRALRGSSVGRRRRVAPLG